MAFSWYDYEVPRWYQATFTKKRNEMLRREVTRRVRILRSLGLSKDEVKLRIRAHLLWDNEPRSSAPIVEEFETIVDDLWQREKLSD